MLEDQIEQDIKAALLSGDSKRVLTLRGLKASILDVKVATGKRETGLNNDEVLPILAKQAKQRQESAELYIQGGDHDRADAELKEKAIIETYLPPQKSDAEINKLIDEVMTQTENLGPQAMGQIIGQVRQKAGATADGAVIARLVKDKLA